MIKHDAYIWHDAPDFRDPAVIQDPIPHYRRMFDHGRPFYDPHDQVWYVFSWAHTRQVLRDKNSSVNRFSGYLQKMPVEKQAVLRPFFENLGRWMTFIDDDTHLLEVIQEMLLPHTSSVAKDINTALDAIADNDFDCLICDVIIPNGGAIELYEKLVLAKHKISQNFIFMTGGIVDPKVQHYIDKLQVPILCKPFGQKELHQAIRANISGSPLESLSNQ